jgi:hypothetical protein
MEESVDWEILKNIFGNMRKKINNFFTGIIIGTVFNGNSSPFGGV